MKKIILATAIILGLSIFAACGGDSGENVINIGATASPHAEVLEQVRPILEENGFTLNIVIFDDFITPNIALDAGDIDINYFQHVPFLNNFNENHGTDLVPIFGVHFEPLRVYAGRLDSLENIPNGATIAIPDDPTNEARALQLLEYLGLIGLTPGLGLSATASDITFNPHNLDIQPLDAPMLPPSLPDVDFAVINGNFALAGGVIDRAIDNAGEAPDSPAALQFTNYIVTRAGNEYSPGLAALIEALDTQTIRDFIYNEYLGRVIPTF
ncbi:MAG: metal ABC transporter substrate-binding protein [Clostridiales bacterium]|jgi:D-methionine transport system substrate-binding protein|nr:metal ABC transporter substrate-binding protein [Clostridiales bacterium]